MFGLLDNWDDDKWQQLMMAGAAMAQAGGQNKRFGAALAPAAVAAMQTRQQQQQDARANRAVAVQEEQNALARQKAEAETAALWQEQLREKQWRDSLTGKASPGVEAYGPRPEGAGPLMVGGTLGADPALSKFFSPQQLQMMADAGRKEGVKMMSDLNKPGEVKFMMDGDGQPIPTRQLPNGMLVRVDTQESISPIGLQPYKPQEYVTLTEGAGGDTRREIRVPANKAVEGKAYKSGGQTIHVGAGEKESEKLALKQAYDWSEKYIAQRPVLDAIRAMDDATKAGTFTGLTAPGAVGVAAFFNGLGIKVAPETYANSRAFQAASRKLGLDIVAATGGAKGYTEKETQMLMETIPQMYDSVEARNIVFDIIKNNAATTQRTYKGIYDRVKKNNPGAAAFLEEPVAFDAPPKSGGYIAESERADYEAWKRKQGR